MKSEPFKEGDLLRMRRPYEWDKNSLKLVLVVKSYPETFACDVLWYDNTIHHFRMKFLKKDWKLA
jgi:hypothetical protein